MKGVSSLECRGGNGNRPGDESLGSTTAFRSPVHVDLRLHRDRGAGVPLECGRWLRQSAAVFPGVRESDRDGFHFAGIRDAAQPPAHGKEYDKAAGRSDSQAAADNARLSELRREPREFRGISKRGCEMFVLQGLVQHPPEVRTGVPDAFRDVHPLRFHKLLSLLASVLSGCFLMLPEQYHLIPPCFP